MLNKTQGSGRKARGRTGNNHNRAFWFQRWNFFPALPFLIGG